MPQPKSETPPTPSQLPADPPDETTEAPAKEKPGRGTAPGQDPERRTQREEERRERKERKEAEKAERRAQQRAEREDEEGEAMHPDDDAGYWGIRTPAHDDEEYALTSGPDAPTGVNGPE